MFTNDNGGNKKYQWNAPLQYGQGVWFNGVYFTAQVVGLILSLREEDQKDAVNPAAETELLTKVSAIARESGRSFVDWIAWSVYLGEDCTHCGFGKEEIKLLCRIVCNRPLSDEELTSEAFVKLTLWRFVTVENGVLRADPIVAQINHFRTWSDEE